ncbi:hypothetical protein F4083_02660, partial [Candidatus Poribacteria bacterium]|nr:hypothetical protein [Candidatus Poribacteria bacterium]
MFGKYFTITLFVLSLCFSMSLCYAHELNINDPVMKAEAKLDNLEGATDAHKDTYNKIHGDLEDLISSWSDAKSKVKDRNATIVFRTGSAIIAGAAAFASGGSYTPAAWMSAMAAHEAITEYPINSGVYLDAMGNAVLVLDKARSNMNNGYSKYTTQYTAYIKLWEGLNITQQDSNGNIPSTPATAAVIESVVNSLNNDGGGWYHPGSTSTTDGEHVIDRKYIPSGVEDDFDYIYKCKGTCKVKFRTPWEAFNDHRAKCGTSTRHYTDDLVLAHRSLAEGCGKIYYGGCNTEKAAKEDAKHKIRWCKKSYIDANGVEYKHCGSRFRRCMKKVYDHNRSDLLPALFSKHSDEEDSDDDDGDDSADTGDDSSSAMHACGIHATTVSGSHSRITPPCGDSAHATYACQISHDHKTTIPGWSGPFYECQPHTNFACGHTDPTANAAYHAPKTCTLTNAQGDSCVATGLYECQSHTCVYPPPTTTTCGGCSQTVSASGVHSATCASG